MIRIPLPLLPLCIKAVRVASEACAYAWAVLADLHDDLRVMVEPRDVSDLCPTPFDMSDAELDAEESFLRHWRELLRVRHQRPHRVLPRASRAGQGAGQLMSARNATSFTSTRPHRWEGGVCARCAIRSHWAGAREACTGLVQPDGDALAKRRARVKAFCARYRAEKKAGLR